MVLCYCGSIVVLFLFYNGSTAVMFLCYYSSTVVIFFSCWGSIVTKRSLLLLMWFVLKRKAMHSDAKSYKTDVRDRSLYIAIICFSFSLSLYLSLSLSQSLYRPCSASFSLFLSLFFSFFSCRALSSVVPILTLIDLSFWTLHCSHSCILSFFSIINGW